MDQTAQDLGLTQGEAQLTQVRPKMVLHGVGGAGQQNMDGIFHRDTSFVDISIIDI